MQSCDHLFCLISELGPEAKEVAHPCTITYAAQSFRDTNFETILLDRLRYSSTNNIYI